MTPVLESGTGRMTDEWRTIPRSNIGRRFVRIFWRFAMENWYFMGNQKHERII